MPSAAPEVSVSAYPYQTQNSANQYSADYTVLTNLSGAQSLDIRVDVPAEVQLIPTDAASGRWIWYSNRGDMSDTTLTRAFDLSGVSSATLHYKAWYHLEDQWDYAYILASADNGATWDFLTTPHSTDANPHSSAYGPGYTGQSENWLDESISLDAYTGKTILLRFEMITDDAISQPGLAIDDVQIPEIGYSSDFETDGGGWEASGWIRVDNRLPQQAWVQAVQQTPNDVTVTRWLAPLESRWSLPLAGGVQQVTLIVAPFAPVTTVTMPYTLTVSVGE
jgi:bacillopeptidase F (M6 metalloprotease family)